MEKEVKLCMIGAGGHASGNMYPYFHLLKNGRFTANADLDEAKARKLAGLFGIPGSYADYHAMLDAEQPDGVVICVGPAFHAETAVELLEAGYHVYTEKPHAETLEQSKRMLAASKRSGKICMTAYKKRFAPAYQKTRAVITSERFGRPVLLTMLRTKWKGRDIDEKYLLHWGCHAIDLLPYMFGRIEKVSTIGTPGNTHAFSINLVFRNGAVGNMSVTDRTNATWEEITAVGTGHVTVRTQNSIIMTAYENDQPFAAHSREWTSGGTNGGVEQGFVGELQEFVDAIAQGRTPEANIVESTHTMAIYEAMVRSLDSGCMEAVEETE